MPLLQLTQIERAAVDEVELRSRHASRLCDRLERWPVFFCETKDQIPPALNLGQTRRIEIDGAPVLVEFPRELLQ